MANGGLLLRGNVDAEDIKSFRHKTYQSLVKVTVEIVLLRKLWGQEQVIDEEFNLSARKGSHGAEDELGARE